MQSPRRTSRLRNITLLLPFDYGAVSEELTFSELSDIQRYRNSALVEKGALVEDEIELRYGVQPNVLPSFVNLDGFPKLRKLFLKGTHIVPLLGLVSQPDARIFRGTAPSLRHVSVHGPFLFEELFDFMHWLNQLSAPTLQSLSLKEIQFGFCTHYRNSWPNMPQLRSLELEGINLAYLQALPCYGLRKLFVASSGNLPSTDSALTYLLETVAKTVEVVSIIQNKQPKFGRANDHHTFSTGFVNALARCLQLRHFESVGCNFFEMEDWHFLCARTFLHLDQVHVEAQHPKLYDRPDHLDMFCTVSLALLFRCSR
jgi:hypothetical protein